MRRLLLPALVGAFLGSTTINQLIGNGKLKSTRWFEGDDVPAFVHRTALRAEGFSTADFEGRPVIGICNSWAHAVSLPNWATW